MRLVLSIVCVALIGSVSTRIVFEEPTDPVHPWEIRNIFPQKLNPHPEKYPLAIEAVLSVALKLQAIENHDGVQENFLVSPLAVAGALGQLMLGAKGDLRKQIGVLLTLREQHEDDFPNRSGTPSQPQNTADPAATAQHHMSNSILVKDVNGSKVVSRFGTVSAQDAASYQVHRAEMRPLPSWARDGLPGLELHRQLGSLIRSLSMPLPAPGTVHPITNSSYLHSSSAFFLDHQLVNISENFVRAIVEFYGSKVVSLNFRNNPVAAQKVVNDWGSRETGGLIKQFLTYPPPSDTAVIQAVAVHFRGAWQTPFIAGGTISGLFKTSANTQVPVKYMRGSFDDAFYAESSSLGIRLLAMPYSNFDCTMYVILPMANNPLKFNVGEMVTRLTSKNLADLVVMAKRRTVNVMFPRLSLTGSLRLASALEKHAALLSKQKADEANGTPSRIAVPPNSTSTSAEKPVGSPSTTKAPIVQNTSDPLRVIPLNDPRPAASSGASKAPESVAARNVKISPRNAPSVPDIGANGASQETPANPELILNAAAAGSNFRISEIIQHIALEVNEAGTEAAAIAGTTMNLSGDVKNFKVDRPFLFFIRHEETNAILFWGTIADPTA